MTYPLDTKVDVMNPDGKVPAVAWAKYLLYLHAIAEKLARDAELA